MSNVFLSIDGENFKSTFEKEGKEEYAAEIGDKKKGSMQFTNLGFYPENNEIEFIDGKLYIPGTLKHGSTLIDFGYISMDVDLPMDTVLEIIEFYMKKISKMKAVLEATK